MGEQSPFFFFDDEKPTDRPLMCGECKKKTQVLYTEVVGQTMTHTRMCAECPELDRRLHGSPKSSLNDGGLSETGICCGTCGTTLEAVKRGALLGCPECYDLFEESIIDELARAHAIPHRLVGQKKNLPFHIGRSAAPLPEVSVALKLLALNDALNDTLKSENYEQAAQIRDQIRKLTEEEKTK